MIAVDEHGPRPQPAQRITRRLARPRKLRNVSGEFDGGTQQSRGERINGEEQNVVTAHGAIGCSSHHRIPVAGSAPSEQARGHVTPVTADCPPLTGDARG